MEMTHFNAEGRPQMVSVEEKGDTLRIAIARGSIAMKPETLKAIEQGKLKKGDVLNVAQIAGIMGAKATSSVIPMCHPLLLTGVNMNFQMDFEQNAVHIEATVKTLGKTGVEMEALTAVSIAGLTIYDMCKAIDKDMVISSIRLMEKEGGKSGTYRREESDI
jgi:cyclic pyranopterin phosphate synthase